MKINKKHYNDFIELTASELRVVARMAERMAEDAELLKDNPTQENFDHLWIMHACMRNAFHAMHKGYLMAKGHVFGRGKSAEVLNAINHLGLTIEKIESNR